MTGIPPGSRRYHELQKLLQRLGIEPVNINWNLLDQALTHSSFDPNVITNPWNLSGMAYCDC
jgi:dsRNA-specific ribonuclease